MIKRLALFSLLLAAPAQAAPIVADLSNYRITMDSSFNGTRMFVFGARGEPGDVVVVVRGPVKDYVVRKKRAVAGLWVNAEKIKLFRIPDFYALISSRPLKELPHSAIFKQLGIGEKALFASPFEGAAAMEGYREFTDAFVAYQRKRHLYVSNATALSFMGETLFKTAIDFPDNIPPGAYNAEIYLVRDNSVVGTQVIPIEVSKVGVDAFIYDYAHHHPFLYGLAAVALALSAGWFAGRLFEKI